MKLITLGFGGIAALVLTLGFSSAPPTSSGDYITFGYGQSAAKVVTLGLGPSATGAQGGSYITLGEGQTASKFVMLGLAPLMVALPVMDHGGRSIARRIPVDRLSALKLERDDELILFIASAALASGLLD